MGYCGRHAPEGRKEGNFHNLVFQDAGEDGAGVRGEGEGEW